MILAPFGLAGFSRPWRKDERTVVFLSKPWIFYRNFDGWSGNCSSWKPLVWMSIEIKTNNNFWTLQTIRIQSQREKRKIFQWKSKPISSLMSVHQSIFVLVKSFCLKPGGKTQACNCGKRYVWITKCISLKNSFTDLVSWDYKKCNAKLKIFTFWPNIRICLWWTELIPWRKESKM